MVERGLFVLRPPSDGAHEMARLGSLLKRGYNLPSRLLPPHLIHLTVQWLEDYESIEPWLPLARRAGASVSMGSFDVAFDRVESWRNALVLRAGEGSASLTSLHRHLGSALKKVGLGANVRSSFTPHISLLRGESHVEEQMVKTFRWTVSELLLVISYVGQSRHVVVESWPLRVRH